MNPKCGAPAPLPMPNVSMGKNAAVESVANQQLTFVIVNGFLTPQNSVWAKFARKVGEDR